MALQSRCGDSTAPATSSAISFWLIVARDQELALLMERWRQVKSGEGQVVLLSGEAGIGKSRITKALIDALSVEPHFLVVLQSTHWPA
jgi:predicted AAA+ superfamily ATPase